MFPDAMFYNTECVTMICHSMATAIGTGKTEGPGSMPVTHSHEIPAPDQIIYSRGIERTELMRMEEGIKEKRSERKVRRSWKEDTFYCTPRRGVISKNYNGEVPQQLLYNIRYYSCRHTDENGTNGVIGLRSNKLLHAGFIVNIILYVIHAGTQGSFKLDQAWLIICKLIRVGRYLWEV